MVRRPRIERGRPKARGSQPTRVYRFPPSAQVGAPGGTRTRTDGALEAHASAGVLLAPKTGTHGRTRTDTSRFRKSASAPSAWVWRPELDSNQRRRLRRPSTGPSAGANWSGRRESNPVAASLATISRTMRARAVGSCRRICTCYLRLIRSVLICMSFAAGIGQDGRTCTCGFRVPGSAVCC